MILQGLLAQSIMKGLIFYHKSSSNGQSCLHTKFQNRSTFPSGRKVMTVQQKVEPWKQWPLKFSGNTFTKNNACANMVVSRIFARTVETHCVSYIADSQLQLTNFYPPEKSDPNKPIVELICLFLASQHLALPHQPLT